MFKDKKIFILGFAKSGYEAAKVLIKRGNKVLINDFNEIKDKEYQEKYQELKSLGVEFFLGSHPDELFNDSYDYLIKNPGIPINHKYVLKAKELNIPVINEVELAYNLLPKDKNIKIIAITGTNGKTTTTTLIYEMLKKAGIPCHLAGNIGYPLCGFLDKLKKDDIIVMETSCQQLENIDKFKPNVAVITNISVAHLEFMETYGYYLKSKKKILMNQDKHDVAILNYNDKELQKFGEDAIAKVKWFSSKEQIKGSYLFNNDIYYYNEKIISIDDIVLRGTHNYENIMAAIMAVKEYNVDNESICKVLKKFAGVEHRLELVRKFKGRSFYNDTEATNIKCTQIALSSFIEPTIIFLGGYERNQNFNDLKNYLTNVKAIIAIGECKDRVEAFANKNNIKVYVFDTLEEGFKKGYEISEARDIILLSPASASWDQYNKCEERGNEFKKYVMELK